MEIWCAPFTKNIDVIEENCYSLYIMMMPGSKCHAFYDCMKKHDLGTRKT